MVTALQSGKLRKGSKIKVRDQAVISSSQGNTQFSGRNPGVGCLDPRPCTAPEWGRNPERAQSDPEATLSKENSRQHCGAADIHTKVLKYRHTDLGLWSRFYPFTRVGVSLTCSHVANDKNPQEGTGLFKRR